MAGKAISLDPHPQALASLRSPASPQQFLRTDRLGATVDAGGIFVSSASFHRPLIEGIE